MAYCFKYANVMMQHSQKFTANHQLCLLLEEKTIWLKFWNRSLLCIIRCKYKFWHKMPFWESNYITMRLWVYGHFITR